MRSSRPSLRRFHLLLHLFPLLFAGCGTTYGEGIYRGNGVAFRLGPTPNSWHPMDVTDALVAFRDDANRASVLVNARCGKDAEDVPLRALTAHLFLNFTEREQTSEDTMPLDGREALRTRMTAKLDGVAKSFDVWVLKKDGCVFDFVYIADPASFSRGASAFEAMVRGFSTIDAS